MTQDLTQAFNAFFSNDASFGSFINGELTPGKGTQIAIHNAATGKEIFSYCDTNKEIVIAAIAACGRAQQQWYALSHANRGDVLNNIAKLILENSENLAFLESLSSNKPIKDCRSEVQVVANMFKYYAGWTDKLYGHVIPVPSGHFNYTQREPLGTVLQMTPWNAPLFTAGWQIAPAIATGNAVLLKPSELTPFSSIALALLIEKAGAPKGLVSVIAGLGQTVLTPALETREIKKVIFVGSVETGRLVATEAAKHLVPSVLELGGKSANIVFADANIDAAVQGAQAAIFAGAGQSCVAGSRLLIQESIYDEFIDKLVTGAAKLKVGNPLDEQTEVGPVCNAKQYQHVQTCIQNAIAEGAEIALGQEHPDGYFVNPTVFKNVNSQMSIAQTEVFGPVVVAIPFKDEADAIKIANDTKFGLAGAVWTNDIGKAHRVANQVKAGTFWINAYKTINVASPFGGYNDSGYGRSSGLDALQEYTQVKSVWVETKADPTPAFGYL